MLFSSLYFIFAFLPLLCLAYFILPWRGYRNALLCAFSLFFYAWGEPRYVLLMILSVALNYYVALALEAKRARGRRGAAKALCVVAILVNLGLLGFFKYSGFVLDNLSALVGRPLPGPRPDLPIGISFYTFQALSYVIDVYRGEVKAQKSLVKLGLYVSLFPQLIAGPIVRYADVAEQIDRRRESLRGFADGLGQFALGLAAKVILANNLAVVADAFFADYRQASAATLWLAAVAYAFQIYFDFSGYSRMAIGLGRMFGFRFMENFRQPYLATSIRDFWRRWHISLSSWFRDYLYIPLGGGRRGPWRHALNLLITWGLTGLWHGAAWNFVLWGLYYAFWIILEKNALDTPLRRLEALGAGGGHWRLISRAGQVLSRLASMAIVLIGWVIFRSVDAGQIPAILTRMWGGGGQPILPYLIGHADSASKALFLPLAFLASGNLPGKIRAWLRRSRAGQLAEALIILCLFLCSLAMLEASTYNPFIYFRF